MAMMSTRDQLWLAGQRFYDALGEELKSNWVKFFQELDSNGDGRVSAAELEAAMQEPGPDGRDAASVNAVVGKARQLLATIDQNGDGELDFDECKALFFAFYSGCWCVACNELILADGATCLECSSSASASDPDRSAASGQDHLAQVPDSTDGINLGAFFSLCAHCIPSHPPAHAPRLCHLPPLIQSPRYDSRNDSRNDSRSLPAAPNADKKYNSVISELHLAAAVVDLVDAVICPIM
jgi:hypothetical protein